MGKTASLANIGSIADSTLGFRNRIINGAMVIDQRNAGTSKTITDTTALTYTLDRWGAYGSVASKFSIQQNAPSLGSVTPPTGYGNYLGVTSLAATTVGASDAYYITQSIEGFNFSDMAWGTASAATITLSFWVRSSLTGTFGGALLNSAQNRSYPFSYTISSANTWEQKTITVAGDTTGTWVGATNGIGSRVFFGLGLGSTYSGTAGAWVGAGNYSVTGATSVVGTNGATFYITGVQLEKGSTATSFDYRPYGTELQLCQRYYQKTFPQATAPAQNAGVSGCVIISSSGSDTGYGQQAPWRLQVPLRATPTTITSYNPSAAASTARNLALSANRTIIALGFGQNGDSAICFTISTSTDSVGMAYAIHYTVDAEL